MRWPPKTDITGPMSRIVPEAKRSRLEFYESHLAPWTENTAAIGLSAPAVAALAAALAEARAAFNAQQEAHRAAQAATLRFHNAMDHLHSAPGLGADLIATIKNHAAVTANPEVYVLAMLPPPPPAVVRGAGPRPGRPFAFSADLLGDGSLRLRWKCRNPRGSTGVMYDVRRAVDGGPPEHLITAGTRSFRDATLPRGAASAVYEITAQRSTARGRTGVFLVNFGVAAAPSTPAALRTNLAA